VQIACGTIHKKGHGDISQVSRKDRTGVTSRQQVVANNIVNDFGIGQLDV
jgi:hypothetical protein